MLREVRPTLRISAKRLTSSPTNTGEWNTMLSAATVAQRPRARRAAALPAARSIWAISQPPKMSPAGLVSDGMAMVRMAGSPLGWLMIWCTSNDESHLRGWCAGVHVAPAVQMVLDLGGRACHSRQQKYGEGGVLQVGIANVAGTIGLPEQAQEPRRDHPIDVDTKDVAAHALIEQGLRHLLVEGVERVAL